MEGSTCGSGTCAHHVFSQFWRFLIQPFPFSAQDQPRGTRRVLRALPLFPKGSHAGWGRWRTLQGRVNRTIVCESCVHPPYHFHTKGESISRLEFVSNMSCPLRFLILLAHGRSALIFRTFSKAGPNPFPLLFYRRQPRKTNSVNTFIFHHFPPCTVFSF